MRSFDPRPDDAYASAAITPDRYAHLFEDDLDAVAVALDHAAPRTDVGELWAEHPAGSAELPVETEKPLASPGVFLP